MILVSFLMNGFHMKTNFKTVTLQGLQLTKNQKMQLENKKKVAFLNATLTSLVDDALANLQAFEEQGGQSEKLWHLELQQSSAPYLGDAFII